VDHVREYPILGAVSDGQNAWVRSDGAFVRLVWNIFLCFVVRISRDGSTVETISEHLLYLYIPGATYEGEWIGNEKSGEGREVDEHGNVYEGFFKVCCYS
jgi:hypothetical protein